MGEIDSELPELLEEVLNELEAAELEELETLAASGALVDDSAATTDEVPTTLERLSELLIDRIVEVRKSLSDQGRKIALTLAEGGSFSVRRNDGLEKRENMIGGEDFTLFATGVSGDGKTLIYYLQPEFAANFNTLYVSENDTQKFGGMSAWTGGHLKELLSKRNDMRQAAAAQREREVIASRSEYKEIEKW